MAKLYFHYSTMNAGKSTLLLQASHNYREGGMHTYLMTAQFDNRAGEGRIASRIGIGGGLLALVILGIGFFWVSSTVDQLAALYQSNFRLKGLGFFGSIQLVLLAGLTGWIGAWIAVFKHLIQIQPR